MPLASVGMIKLVNKAILAGVLVYTTPLMVMLFTFVGNSVIRIPVTAVASTLFCVLVNVLGDTVICALNVLVAGLVPIPT